jgi:hypothetical protein
MTSLTIAIRHITLTLCRVFDLRLLRGPSQSKPWNHLVRINEMLTCADLSTNQRSQLGHLKLMHHWKALHHFATPEDDRITLDLTRDQVKAAPEYKDGGPLVVITTSD